MSASALKFELLDQDRDPSSRARLGRVTTAHGSFDTPAFMPVGTQGSIKGLPPSLVDGESRDGGRASAGGDSLARSSHARTGGVGAQIILANTYHLLLRPGPDLVAEMGGLHTWMRWGRPILTDSGGFQVFSLADIRRISDAGVTFKSHLDGATIELTPARSIEIQNKLGADIIMAFDDCPPAMATDARAGSGAVDRASPQRGPGELDEAARRRRVLEACERSNRWLDACVEAHERTDEQALFGIVQGGVDLELRDRCVEAVCGHDLPGFAIGGVAVGESHEQIVHVVRHTAAKMPSDKPRYLMGVGYERDILQAVRAGVDMFDCVLPTRNGRNANAFTRSGPIRLRNARFRADPKPIDEACDCLACVGGFSRSYIRHLFQAGEMLGPMLVSLHNLRHFQRLLLDIRRAIQDNHWSLLARAWPVLDGSVSAAASQPP